MIQKPWNVARRKSSIKTQSEKNNILHKISGFIYYSAGEENNEGIFLVWYSFVQSFSFPSNCFSILGEDPKFRDILYGKQLPKINKDVTAP